ncbi:AfsR/SARP family transcriptional regulator [Kitasatospora sp. MAP5-34]|uniref:AfsR/SARP family transcriptional regulator n=1 Tax=Kitasatospora sp. MAP5-34 TaxID=3035102 RepID=UPI002473146C|nr:AfsR/SARP family transcriptional regulator [Kitasatospora sp. MAP5-34]MDH6579758.1 DNA-binding SARP family transcriptional activator [Kitasatospora sp. MAP5-34]
MDVQVLGPLAAAASGTSIVPTATKPRQILALLALNAGRIVSVPQLMEELWGTELPRSAATTLQTYILQLRRNLRTALRASPPGTAEQVLATRHGGYVLALEPAMVDADEFDRLAVLGYAAYGAGDMTAASALLGSALAKWRGPVLVDVRHGHHLSIEVTRLEESRIGVLERRVRADLRLGRHHELIGELSALTGHHPLDESLHAHLIVALYRCGRAPRALAVYQKLRDTLVDELGLEPSGQLQRLQRAILCGDQVRDYGLEGAGLPLLRQPRLVG